MAHDVFISHAAADKGVAAAVCAHLEQGGTRCWIAPRDVLPGSARAASLFTAIEEARVFVLIYTETCNRSEQVLRELERAVASGVPILPFRVQDAEPTEAVAYYVGTTRWLDAITPPLERHIERLGETVAALLHPQPERPSIEPPPSEASTRAGGAAARLRGRTPKLVVPAALAVVGVALLLWLLLRRPASTAAPPATSTPAAAPVRILDPTLEQPATRGGVRGIAIRARLEIDGRSGVDTVFAAAFYGPGDKPLLDMDGQFSDPDGNVAVSRVLTPESDKAVWKELELFLPYEQLHLSEKQDVPQRTYDLFYRLRVVDYASGKLLASTAPRPFRVPVELPPQGQVDVSHVWFTYDVLRNDRRGMLVHASLRIDRRKGKPTEVTAFFRRANGAPLEDLDGQYARNGHVAVGERVTPLYDHAVFDDVQLFMPYEELHVRPDQPAELEVVLETRDAADGTLVGDSAPQPFHLDPR